MGPRLLRRGDHGCRVSCQGSCGCFNGAAAVTPRRWAISGTSELAAAMLQWGRGCYAAEILKVGMHSANCYVLQWGRGCYAAEISTICFSKRRVPACFNGAAAVTPRRSAQRHRRHAAAALASMGPRLLRRGDLDRPSAGTDWGSSAGCERLGRTGMPSARQRSSYRQLRCGTDPFGFQRPIASALGDELARPGARAGSARLQNTLGPRVSSSRTGRPRDAMTWRRPSVSPRSTKIT